jgi:thioredoxin 1
MEGNMETANIDGSFDQIVRDNPIDKYLIVDFWAPWCAPCKAMVPILSQIESENKDRVDILKVNIEEHQKLAEKFDVQGLPFFVIFKGNNIFRSFSGTKTKRDILGALNG